MKNLVGRGISEPLEYELTNNVKDVIEIEKGRPRFAAINPSSNRIYILYLSGDVLVVDLCKKTIISKIDLVRKSNNWSHSDEIQINPIANLVYVCTDNRVSIIDGFTNKIVGPVVRYRISWFKESLATLVIACEPNWISVSIDINIKPIIGPEIMAMTNETKKTNLYNFM